MPEPLGPISRRIAHCFQAVFPQVPEDRVTGMAMPQVAEWDSVNQAILMATIEDEFGISIPAEQYAVLTTFGLVCEYVGRSIPGPESS